MFDSRTGCSISNHVIGVSILADICILADGLAIGVMVLGSEKSLELIHKWSVMERLIGDPVG